MEDWLFLFGKLGWALARPSGLALAAVAAGTALLWTRHYRAGRLLVSGAALWLALAMALPVGRWLAAPLENRFPAQAEPGRVDGIIVLGGAVNPELTAERGIPALNQWAERMTTFVALARRHPEARLIFTGGSGALRPGHLREADVAESLFAQLGLPPSRVLFERRSRNTHENFSLTSPMMAPKPGETWLLVTSAMHMPRAVGCARAVGWKVVPWPVAYKTGVTDVGGGAALPSRLDMVDMAAREWTALAWYRLMGWQKEWFPGPEPREPRSGYQPRS